MVTKDYFKGLGILNKEILVSALVLYSHEDLNSVRFAKVNELITALSY